MKKFPRALLALCGFMFGLQALAQESGGGAIDITPATTVLTKLQAAIEAYWAAAEPFIVAVVGLVVVAALIWAGVRLFKGGTSKISGR